MTGTSVALKNRLRSFLGEDSREWRLLHRARVELQRVLPPKLEPAISIEEWERLGNPAPPPHAVKERIVEAYARASAIRTLIETGTYTGEMISAVKDRFDAVVTIELSKRLARRARRRFRSFPQIRVLQGDSARVLEDLLPRVSSRCLFWLDSHYSSGITALGEAATPVMRELELILSHRIESHVILVDDARLFTGVGGFPAIDEIRQLVSGLQSSQDFSVRNDVIRIHPGPPIVSDF